MASVNTWSSIRRPTLLARWSRLVGRHERDRNRKAEILVAQGRDAATGLDGVLDRAERVAVALRKRVDVADVEREAEEARRPLAPAGERDQLEDRPADAEEGLRGGAVALVRAGDLPHPAGLEAGGTEGLGGAVAVGGHEPHVVDHQAPVGVRARIAV